MNILQRFAICLVVLCLTAAVGARAADKQVNPVNFGSGENVLELKQTADRVSERYADCMIHGIALEIPR